MGVAWETGHDAGKEFYPLVRAPQSGYCYFLLLGHPEGALMHFVDRNKPCLGKSCQHCRNQIRRTHWDFYPAFAFDSPPGRAVILELPEGASAGIGDADLGTLLRVWRAGKRIVARRIDNLDRPPDFPGWIASYVDRGDFPEYFDVRAALLRIWRLPPEPVVSPDGATIQLRKQA